MSRRILFALSHARWWSASRWYASAVRCCALAHPSRVISCRPSSLRASVASPASSRRSASEASSSCCPQGSSCSSASSAWRVRSIWSATRAVSTACFRRADSLEIENDAENAWSRSRSSGWQPSESAMTTEPQPAIERMVRLGDLRSGDCKGVSTTRKEVLPLLSGSLSLIAPRVLNENARASSRTDTGAYIEADGEPEGGDRRGTRRRAHRCGVELGHRRAGRPRSCHSSLRSQLAELGVARSSRAGRANLSFEIKDRPQSATSACTGPLESATRPSWSSSARNPTLPNPSRDAWERYDADLAKLSQILKLNGQINRVALLAIWGAPFHPSTGQLRLRRV